MFGVSKMKKSLGRFIFEFVLLFLAITAGFFVENLREDFSEKKQEKELIKTMAEDLKIDIKSLQRIIATRDARRQMLDSLTLLINSKDQRQWTHLTYVQGKKVSRSLDFAYISVTRTYEQLKNANGFRLIGNQQVSENISKYYEQVRLINQLETQELLFIELYLPICYQIFDGLVFDKIVSQDGHLLTLPENFNPPLLKSYENHLNELNGNLNNIKSVNKRLKDDEVRLTNQAAELIEFIKKEYKLD
jgi:hypothetical protein